MPSVTRRRMSGEGSIYPVTVRGRKVWVAQLSIGPREARRYERRKRRTYNEAKAALDEMRSDRAAGRAPSKQPLGAYLRAWLEETVDVRPNTRRGYEDAIRHWAPIAGIALAELTASDIERASAKMRSTRYAGKRGLIDQGPAAPKTVRNAQVMLRSALQVAADRGYVRRNEAALVKLRRVPPRRKEALTPDAARAIVAAIAGDRYEAVYWLNLLGLRASEALGLSWSDIDWETRTVHIRQQLVGSGRTARLGPTKTEGSAADIRLPAIVLDKLRAWQTVQAQDRLRAGQPGKGTGLVFTTPSGYAVNGSYLTRHFQALLERAGLPKMTVHELRHGFATLLAAINVHPAVAQRLLRHAKAATTLDIYTHVTADQEWSAVDAIGDLLAKEA